MSEPEVRKFLTVSASHLPEAYADRLLQTVFDAGGAAAAFCGFYGTMLWAPEKPEEHDFDDMPESVRDILIYASGLGCAYVLFDTDGEVLDGFATYDGDEIEVRTDTALEEGTRYERAFGDGNDVGG